MHELTVNMYFWYYLEYEVTSCGIWKSPLETEKKKKFFFFLFEKTILK